MKKGLLAIVSVFVVIGVVSIAVAKVADMQPPTTGSGVITADMQPPTTSGTVYVADMQPPTTSVSLV